MNNKLLGSYTWTWLQIPKGHMRMNFASSIRNHVQILLDITAGCKVLIRKSIISRCALAIIILLFCIPSVAQATIRCLLNKCVNYNRKWGHMASGVWEETWQIPISGFSFLFCTYCFKLYHHQLNPDLLTDKYNYIFDY